jgi:DNA ligase-1
MPGVRRPDPEQAATVLDDALSAGHEGVVVKALGAPYAAGRRGKAWQKVKPVHTLDLVVPGRRVGVRPALGKLSNIHLGARDPDGGEPVMVGKTFKGMTDELLDWQTAPSPASRREQRRLGRAAAARAGRRDRAGRRQRSPRYPAASRCASPACCATAPTRPRPRPTTIDAVRSLMRE